MHLECAYMFKIILLIIFNVFILSYITTSITLKSNFTKEKKMMNIYEDISYFTIIYVYEYLYKYI